MRYGNAPLSSCGQDGGTIVLFIPFDIAYVHEIIGLCTMSIPTILSLKLAFGDCAGESGGKSFWFGLFYSTMVFF